ncbi:MAG: hypothetical protein IKC56_02910, partial [Clostridia bacterium]|nr:hypothetical protein [Clostridia bacterium]
WEIYTGKYQRVLTEKYGVTGQEETPLQLLDCVVKRRGFLLRGGEYDYDRAARAVIDDFSKGRLGGVSLELPPKPLKLSLGEEDD